MNSGKTIFAQLMDFVPTYEFRKCVDRYNGNHKLINTPLFAAGMVYEKQLIFIDKFR